MVTKLFELSHVYIGDGFEAKMLTTAARDSHYCTCLGHLGWHNKDLIISIDQGKYSSDCRVLLSLTFLNTNFANVNEPLIHPKNSPKEVEHSPHQQKVKGSSTGVNIIKNYICYCQMFVIS